MPEQKRQTLLTFTLTLVDVDPEKGFEVDFDFHAVPNLNQEILGDAVQQLGACILQYVEEDFGNEGSEKVSEH